MSAEERTLYAETLTKSIFVRRFTSVTAFHDTAAHARVSGYQANELVANIQQGDRLVIVNAKDLVDAGFSLPITLRDWIVIDGLSIRIISADNDTRRSLDGELLAVVIQARG